MRLLITALLLAGCARSPAQSTPPPPVEGGCDAAPRAASGRPPVQRRARRGGAAPQRRADLALAAARQIVTMEYRADRLNLHLDAQDRVERIDCG